MRTIKRDIVGGLLFSNDEHVLVGKNVKGGVYEDLWVIPAGGIDPGETKVEALIREIMEEVGIDIRRAVIRLLPEVQTAKTQKTLRDTGERVLVDMTFYNFKVMIDKPSTRLPIVLEDDFGYAEWVAFRDLGEKPYSPSVRSLLKSQNLM